MNDSVEVGQSLVPVERIADCILILRGQKVILDSDLARLYGTSTMRLNQAVKRNRNRFPEDFIFQLTPEEKQEVITNRDNLGSLKFSPVCPYAFTEHGAVMVATVLKTDLAATASIYVVRAFVRLRELLSTHAELSQKLRELESRVEARLDAHDEQIGALIDAIRELMIPPDSPKRRIGFRTRDDS
jgi:hypothetical protein